MKREELFDMHQHLTAEALEIMRAKNHDYGRGTESTFANLEGTTALGVNPVTGVSIRILDKLNRIETYVQAGKLKVQDESVKDTIMDSINYLVLMYGLILQQERTNLNFPENIGPQE